MCRQDMLEGTSILLHSWRHSQDKIRQRPQRHDKSDGQAPLPLRPQIAKLRSAISQQPHLSREAGKLLLRADKLHSESGMPASGHAGRAEEGGGEGFDV